MKTAIAGMVLRSTKKSLVAEFYKALGLQTQESQHGGPVHFEITPLSPQIVFELYQISADQKVEDRLMIEVESLEHAREVLNSISILGASVQSTDTLQFILTRDPDGRSLMLFEKLKASSSDSNDFHESHCVPCDGNTKQLSEGEILEFCAEHIDWARNGPSIYRDYELKTFADAMRFLNAIGEQAELENHHPDLALMKYKHVRVSWTTFAAGGLTENDFIMAARCDYLFSQLPS